MGAREILATLQRRGATVRALELDQIEVAPRRVLDDELRAAIRTHKAEVLAEIRQSELADAPILETRERLGAVLIRSRRFDCDVWLALSEEMAADLRAEEAKRPAPRPVLLPEDLAALRGKPEAAIRAVLEVATVFPGTRVLLQ